MGLKERGTCRRMDCPRCETVFCFECLWPVPTRGRWQKHRRGGSPHEEYCTDHNPLEKIELRSVGIDKSEMSSLAGLFEELKRVDNSGAWTPSPLSGKSSWRSPMGGATSPW